MIRFEVWPPEPGRMKITESALQAAGEQNDLRSGYLALGSAIGSVILANIEPANRQGVMLAADELVAQIKGQDNKKSFIDGMEAATETGEQS